MFQDQRVIYQTQDLSKDVNDFRSGSSTVAYTTGQYIYIGSIMPFNNLWFELDTANSNTATVSIQIWYGNEWQNAVDIIDETNGLNNTGRLSWNTDRLKSWDIEQDSDDVDGLETKEIYDKFWLRLSWNANFSASTSISYIGQKFSDDQQLYSFYPDFNKNNVLEGFATGKTSWDEQHFMAAEFIVADLKNRGIIRSRSQLMDYSIFNRASCRRVAVLIYTAFGSGYLDQLEKAEKDYMRAMDLNLFQVDKSGDGSLQPTEQAHSSWYGTR